MASVWVRAEQPGSDWPVIKRWLERAADHARVRPDTLAPGEILFVARRFVGLEPVAVGAATVGMAGDAVEVVLGGGDKAAAMPIFNAALDLARLTGAKALIAQGRAGWARILPFPVERKEPGCTYYRLEF